MRTPRAASSSLPVSIQIAHCYTEKEKDTPSYHLLLLDAYLRIRYLKESNIIMFNI